MRCVALLAGLLVLALLVVPGMLLAQAPETILIEQGHVFLVPLEDHIYVAEYYLLSNTGDEAYTGDAEGATVYFTLPEGADSLVFEGDGLGERFVGDKTRFADTRSIPPGSATIEVGFSYALPYPQDQALERVYEVPVRSLALVVNGESVSLEGEGLVATGAMDTQMGPAMAYSAGPLAPGDPLAFTLVSLTGAEPGTPDVPARSRQRNAAQDVVVGVVALAAAGIAAYVLWQPPATSPMPPAARPLVEQIAALDARFAAAEVDEAVYRQQRQRLKRQLRERLQPHRAEDA